MSICFSSSCFAVIILIYCILPWWVISRSMVLKPYYKRLRLCWLSGTGCLVADRRQRVRLVQPEDRRRLVSLPLSLIWILPNCERLWLCFGFSVCAWVFNRRTVSCGSVGWFWARGRWLRSCGGLSDCLVLVALSLIGGNVCGWCSLKTGGGLSLFLSPSIWILPNCERLTALLWLFGLCVGI